MSKVNFPSTNDIKNEMLVNELKKNKKNKDKTTPNIDG